MAEKPILFNTEMVRAILEGRKTQTRRPIRDKDIINWFDIESDGRTVVAYIDQATGDSYEPTIPCPYQPGDLLWVRETWCYGTDTHEIMFDPEPLPGDILYKADAGELDRDIVKWRPSIHMPREAARLFLRVTDVWVERLQEILPYHIQEEGCLYHYSGFDHEQAPDWKGWFRERWDHIYAKKGYGWESNPWVWAISFEVIEKHVFAR